jgi:hypothetical protein
LLFEISIVTLEDANPIDPDVSNLQHVGVCIDILEKNWQILSADGFFSGCQRSFVCEKRVVVDRSPTVADRNTLGMHILEFDQLDTRFIIGVDIEDAIRKQR